MFAAQLAFRTAKADAVKKCAKHVLYLDASHGPSSLIAHGAQALVAELENLRPDLQVKHLALWDKRVRTQMEYNLEHVQAKMAMLGGSTRDEDIQCFANVEELAAQIATAEGVIISAPMWNYGAPWVVKQYFDCVLHPGLTFLETPSGPKGLLGGGRPLVIITSSGGAAQKDHLSPWLIDMGAMMGFDMPLVVSASNAAHSERNLLLESIACDAKAAAQHFSKARTSAPVAELPREAQDEEEDEEEEEAEDEVSASALLLWLRAQGGISEDAMESIEAARIDGGLFMVATEDDWRNEELGLEDEDVARLIELQGKFRKSHSMPA